MQVSTGRRRPRGCRSIRTPGTSLALADGDTFGEPFLQRHEVSFDSREVEQENVLKKLGVERLLSILTGGLNSIKGPQYGADEGLGGLQLHRCPSVGPKHVLYPLRLPHDGKRCNGVTAGPRVAYLCQLAHETLEDLLGVKVGVAGNLGRAGDHVIPKRLVEAHQQYHGLVELPNRPWVRQGHLCSFYSYNM